MSSYRASAAFALLYVLACSSGDKKRAPEEPDGGGAGTAGTGAGGRGTGGKGSGGTTTSGGTTASGGAPATGGAGTGGAKEAGAPDAARDAARDASAPVCPVPSVDSGTLCASGEYYDRPGQRCLTCPAPDGGAVHVLPVSCGDIDLGASRFDNVANEITVVVSSRMRQVDSASARVTHTYFDGGTGAPPVPVSIRCANELVLDVSGLGIVPNSQVTIVDLQGTDVCGTPYRFSGSLRFRVPVGGTPSLPVCF